MIEVIPTIIAQSFEEVQKTLRMFEPHVKWMHLDVMDGNFVEAITWDDPRDLARFDTTLLLEADLMVEEPEKIIGPWLESKVKRIFVPYESFDEPEFRIPIVSSKVRAAGKEFGISQNPETPPERLFPLFPYMDRVLLRGATPGKYSQSFQEKVIHKVDLLSVHFSGIIEVDGGVRPPVVGHLCKAGAKAFAVGSPFFLQSHNMKEAIQNLEKNCLQ